jgi:hypothetical protein
LAGLHHLIRFEFDVLMFMYLLTSTILKGKYSLHSIQLIKSHQ